MLRNAWRDCTLGLRPNDTLATFMERLKGRDAERIVLDDLAALFLRNESIDDLRYRPWASPLGVVFGQMLAERGVTVVNNPSCLGRATSKLYLEEFPAEGGPLRRQAAVRVQGAQRLHDRGPGRDEPRPNDGGEDGDARIFVSKPLERRTEP